MTYNIFDRTAPAMPRPGKGTEICKLLLSQATKDMREPLVPMAIPALAAHLTDVEFMYSDNKYYELCGQMGHLIGPSGIGKAQLTHLIEAIMRSFRDHDETEYKKLVDWQRQVKSGEFFQRAAVGSPAPEPRQEQRGHEAPAQRLEEPWLYHLLQRTAAGPALAGPPPAATRLQGLQRLLPNPWLTANNPPLSRNNDGLFLWRKTSREKLKKNMVNIW